MSELKPYIGPHPTDHTLTEYYLKSEADKVIAELKKKLEDTISSASITCEAVRRCNEEIRHQKYKRCLAMAKVCYLRFVRYDNYLQKLCASNATIAAYKFNDKWEKRWLELAEKFKEAK